MPDPLHRLCALVTGLDDRVRDAVEAASGFTGVAPDALATIGHAPGLRVEDLASMLRVSHSGAVRTVDRLVAAGLVERRPSAGDRRTVELWLTPAGGRARRQVLAARDRVLGDAVGVLDPGGRDALAELVDRLLTGLAARSADDHSLCRLCDPDDCTAGCPVDVGVGSAAGVGVSRSAGYPAAAAFSPPRSAEASSPARRGREATRPG
ncbi:MAG TPA: MarR family winged helix-turn-helix transcriptional regulator [Acidimicrobiales bacterium]|nr:MarR family winged helix-turn-helix transcriptional regulator [Acidimicrobiales bacterium]